MRAGERYALMPFQLETRNGVHSVNVCQQLQWLGADAEIPSWLDATRIRGGAWLTSLKTRSSYRFVPLSDGLWGRLWDRIRLNGIGEHDLVFTTARGGPVTVGLEGHHWKKALEYAGLPHVTVHSARHWASTMLARSGAPEDERTALMGHTSLDMTAHYTHWDDASLARMLDTAIPELQGDVHVESVVEDE